MVGISKAISDKLYKKAEDALVKCKRSGDVSRKLQAIISAKKYGITHVAEVFLVSRFTIMQWIKFFENEGEEGLKLKAGRGRKSILSLEEQLKVKEWIESNSSLGVVEVMNKIKSHFGKEIKKSATHNLMRNLGYSYITPRPSHYSQNKEDQAKFKKKSNQQDQ